MQPIIRNAEDFSWVFLVILGIGVMLVLLKFLFYKSFSSLNNLTMFREVEEGAVPFAIIVNVMLGILAGLIGYHFLKLPAFLAKETWMAVIFLMGGAIIFILTKFIINAIVSSLVSERDEFKIIVRTKIFYRVYLLIILVLLTLMLYFSEFNKLHLLYIALGSVAVVLLSEYYQQLSHSKLKDYLKSYYLILYLCILEILPILYIYLHWYR